MRFSRLSKYQTMDKDGWVKVVFLGDCIFEEWDEDKEFAECPKCGEE
jgi:hypothetical protein